MPIEVSDVRSNPQDQIAHAGRVLGRSDPRRKVFAAIHAGKKQAKTIGDIEKITGLPRKTILNEARVLFNNNIVRSTKINGELAYVKDPFYTANKDKILRLASNPKALERFPTKTNPRTTSTTEVILRLPKPSVRIQQLTIDDIDSFEKVVGVQPTGLLTPILERFFKDGLKRILHEEGDFQDWGGETDDLFSTRMILNGVRVSVALGLKGKGTSGKLTPDKMGKHGDQIQRLFRAPADVFIVQYWGQVDESVYEQMKAFATMKSVLEDRTIYFGVIDGQDTTRMIQAYPENFAERSST